MPDRELLEAAAKAAGKVAIWCPIYNHTDVELWAYDETGHPEEGTRWNPLTDDGDNRRLQVKLNLGLVPQEEGAWVCITYDGEGDEMALAVDVDPNRAIVRAAAARGAAK